MIISVIGYKGGVGKTTIANYIANRLREYGYVVSSTDNNAQFVIYDLDFNYRDFSNFPKSLKIFVCDLPSLHKTHEFSLFIDGKKILVINKISPIPKDILKYLNQIENLKDDFDEIYLVPFNGGLFNGIQVEEPVLDILVQKILREAKYQVNIENEYVTESIDKKIVYPFV